MYLVKKIVNRVAKDYPTLKKIFNPNSLRVKFFKRLISMKNFLRSLNTFFNPNSLELFCYWWCKNHKWKLPGYLFFQKICSTAIQINTVNIFAGKDDYIHSLKGNSVIELNEKYRSGFRLDIDFVTRKRPISTHSGAELFKLVKY
jgi:hypothetical protein